MTQKRRGCAWYQARLCSLRTSLSRRTTAKWTSVASRLTDSRHISVFTRLREGSAVIWWRLRVRAGVYCEKRANVQPPMSPCSQGWALRSFPFARFRSFPFLLKNVLFFSVLFSSFWLLMRPKRMFRSFPFFRKERKECNVLLQITQCSFAKNIKERKECNIL